MNNDSESPKNNLKTTVVIVAAIAACAVLVGVVLIGPMFANKAAYELGSKLLDKDSKDASLHPTPIQNDTWFDVTMTLNNRTEYHGLISGPFSVYTYVPSGGRDVYTETSNDVQRMHLMTKNTLVQGPASNPYTSLTFFMQSKSDHEVNLGMAYDKVPEGVALVGIDGQNAGIFNHLYNITDSQFVPHFSIKPTILPQP